MMKATIIKRGLLILLLPLIIVSTLAIRYRIRHAPLENFTRVIFKEPLQPFTLVHTSAQRYAGEENGRHYFTGQSPKYLLSYDKALTHPKRLELNIKPTRKMQSRFHAMVQPGKVTLFAGNYPAVIQVDIPGSHTASLINIKEGIFSRICAINDSVFIVRGYMHNSGLNQLFYRYNTSSKKIEKQAQTFIQDDAGLSSDGLLHYDKIHKQLLYIQFYTNKIYVFNPDLTIIKIDSTINPNPTTSTEFSQVGTQSKQIKNTSPKQVINRRSCIARNILFNQSGIKSKDEKLSTFRENAIIDCYSLADTRYMGSFYIPLKGQQLFDFGIHEGTLIAVYSKSIVSYKLPKDLYN
ncbi:hypothetical protein [Olivibacter domesticus]|uniref:Uncharacterized protein n=1 Tax=Olivibacter domesticus TaxID=407022 RepID=A0A1H7WN07_OLID1|nr:hypothetical protein [Olivibacter domesticus]SEM22900.1 hypothetical protein SAMN05661044_04582 [Olivibacter domesticus]